MARTFYWDGDIKKNIIAFNLKPIEIIFATKEMSEYLVIT